ncbi:MAG TPA: hypothetical protein VMY69_03795 [Phycisphaerae bacterium]|nr:hypothetical protein [Phycisphaerae bacterium]
MNVGLRDYPESREFFQKLVETKSIYRRDWNKAAHRREGEPFVPLEIEKYAGNAGNPDPVQIFALVNYKQFWDSGLARKMIDEFYAKLPFAPPMLYLCSTQAGAISRPVFPTVRWVAACKLKSKACRPSLITCTAKARTWAPRAAGLGADIDGVLDPRSPVGDFHAVGHGQGTEIRHPG